MAAMGAEEDVWGADRELMFPGLPQDMGMECLARVPSWSHGRMSRVCSGWRGSVGSAEFQRRRRVAGAVEDILILVQARAGGAVSAPGSTLAVVNLTTGEWRHVDGPAGPLPLFAQCAAAGDGRHVAVFGGWDPDTFRTRRDVHVLDLPAGVWRRGQPMPDKRSFFGCADGGDGNVYVAGGHDDEKNALRSALAYNVAADAWRALPDMSEERDEPQLLAVPGLGVVLAASGYATETQGAFKNTAECYAGGGGVAWTSEGDDVPAATGTTHLASVRGTLWAVGAGNGGVREWDAAARAWRDVADGPPGMKVCLKAVGIGDGAALFVFGTVADAASPVNRLAARVMDAATAAWRSVPVPPGFQYCAVYSAAAMQV